MELYRYLFAPVLLAVAVWSGHHQRHPAPRPEHPAAVEVAPVVRPAVQRPDAGRRGGLPPQAPVPVRRDVAR